MKRIFAAVAVAAVVSAGLTAPVLADNPGPVVYHGGGGKGWANWESMPSGTLYVWHVACDTQVDGNRVRNHYKYEGSSYNYVGIYWAPSGGCVTEYVNAYARIAYLRVCIENEGCTGYVRQL
jgi:hypothetical protein